MDTCHAEEADVWEVHKFKSGTGLSGDIGFVKGPILSLNRNTQGSRFTYDPRKGTGDFVFKSSVNTLGNEYIQFVYELTDNPSDFHYLVDLSLTSGLDLYQNADGDFGYPSTYEMTRYNQYRACSYCYPSTPDPHTPYIDEATSVKVTGIAMLTSSSYLHPGNVVSYNGDDWHVVGQLSSEGLGVQYRNTYLLQLEEWNR